MAKSKVSLSNEELSITEIQSYYRSTEKALRSYYRTTNHLFVNTNKDILQSELDELIDELDKSTAFTILATIEAHVRIDFLQRCYNKDKDDLSRKFRALHKQKGSKVSLPDDILELWKEYVSDRSVIYELKSALKFRHWLAHGRYWVAKTGRKYDFNSVLTLAVFSQTSMNIDMGA